MEGIEIRDTWDASPAPRKSRLLRIVGAPPADRPRWRRGRRAPLAVIAVVMSLAALLARSESNGGGGSARRTIDYRADGPEWVDPALLAAAALLVLAALVLWAARPAGVVLLAWILVPLVIAGSVYIVVLKHTIGRVSAAEVRAVPSGATKSEVRTALGPPAGHGSLKEPSGNGDCLMYSADRLDRHGWRQDHFFCFRDDRLVARETW